MRSRRANPTNHGIVRRSLTVALTIVAALASIATSDPHSIVDAEPASGRFVLSPTETEVRIPFTLSVSEAAARGEAQVFIKLSPAWLDTPQSVMTRGLDVVIETPTGTLREHERCLRDCVGSNVLVVRWPLEAESGRALVSWTLTPIVEFGSDNPPDGATVEFNVSPPPGIPAPVTESVAILGDPFGMAVTRFDITAANPVPSLALTLRGARYGAGKVFILNKGTWVDIGPDGGRSGLLNGCDTYPCHLTVIVVAMPAHLGQVPNALHHEIAATEPTPSLEVAVDDVQPWQSPVSDHHLSLALSETLPTMTFPVSVVLPYDVGSTPTLVHFEVAATAADVVERVDISAYDRLTGRRGGLGWLNAMEPNILASQSLAPECDTSGCLATFELTVLLREEYSTDVREHANLEIDLRASFLFPSRQPDLPALVFEIGDPK